MSSYATNPMSKTTTIVREGESCEVTCINPGKVRSLARSLPRTSSVERISTTFQIMSDPSRLKILYCVSQGEAEPGAFLELDRNF